jgi:ribosome biogenesis GTPase A
MAHNLLTTKFIASADVDSNSTNVANALIEQHKNESCEIIKRDNVNNDYSGSESIILKKDNYVKMPIRPSIVADAKKQKDNEQLYFNTWLTDIKTKYTTERLNWFEQNIEVWRQLWRVIEYSDILLLVVDSRHPLSNFPVSMYDYVTNIIKKPLILVMNKIDLIPNNLIKQWVDYFKTNYPNLIVVPFTIYPENRSETINFTKLQKFKTNSSILLEQPFGSKELYDACKKIIDADPNISQIIKQNFSFVSKVNNISDSLPKYKSIYADADEYMKMDITELTVLDINKEQGYIGPKNDNNDNSTPSTEFITIGTIGHPNAGKSSCINALVGKKVVSVSNTPGHTKHLQTLFLNKHTRLCDCPGLVFCVVDMPKSHQVITGSYPIAQCRDPYSAITYLARMIPLELIYKLNIKTDELSAWKICETLAEKKGFYSRKGSVDVYRAANFILRDVLSGAVTFYYKPPT